MDVIVPYMQENFRFISFWITKSAMEVKPEQVFFVPQGGRNHIAWLLGHACMAMDTMGSSLLAGTPKILPAAYHDAFGMDKDPEPLGRGYPPFADMITQFRALGKAAVTVIGRLHDSDLSQPPEGMHDPKLLTMFPNKGAILRGNALHLAYHHGQINMLRKMQERLAGAAG